ncbi:MAG: hypothetical protein CVV49_10330 [Spirochaetae bacterium HGW-Spirochaetae-5]|nr:MAG: hypothetical protein CVV49_10330 [Spirochaetae bacterium HGW-Spirochaetae-5]
MPCSLRQLFVFFTLLKNHPLSVVSEILIIFFKPFYLYLTDKDDTLPCYSALKFKNCYIIIKSK